MRNSRSAGHGASSSPTGNRRVLGWCSRQIPGLRRRSDCFEGRRSRTLADATTAVWFVESADYFLPPSFTRSSLAELCQDFRVAAAPAAVDSTRTGRALAIVDRSLESRLPADAFLAGDGAVIYPMRDRLIAAGMQKENIHVEAFFNNPERKAQS